MLVVLCCHDAASHVLRQDYQGASIVLGGAAISNAPEGKLVSVRCHSVITLKGSCFFVGDSCLFLCGNDLFRGLCVVNFLRQCIQCVYMLNCRTFCAFMMIKIMCTMCIHFRL